MHEAILPTPTASTLSPKETSIARAYDLPKNHKTGNPLRMSVPLVGSPTHNLSKGMLTHLKPIIVDSEHINSNSLALAECTKHVSIFGCGVALYKYGVRTGNSHTHFGCLTPRSVCWIIVFLTTCGLTAVCTSRSSVRRWASQCLGPLVKRCLKHSKVLLSASFHPNYGNLV